MRETSVGVYAENSTQWTPWLRSVAGLRADRFDFDVDELDRREQRQAAAPASRSPKLSLIFGPWRKTEYFVNYGYGFHSNDARGTTATRRTPKRPASRPTAVDRPLVRSKGGELGLRTEIVPGLQSSLALWQLRARLRAGVRRRRRRDRGEPAPAGATASSGTTTTVAAPWLLLDADFARVARALHRRPDPDASATASRARSTGSRRSASTVTDSGRGSASSSCATSARAR